MFNSITIFAAWLVEWWWNQPVNSIFPNVFCQKIKMMFIINKSNICQLIKSIWLPGRILKEFRVIGKQFKLFSSYGSYFVLKVKSVISLEYQTAQKNLQMRYKTNFVQNSECIIWICVTWAFRLKSIDYQKLNSLCILEKNDWIPKRILHLYSFNIKESLFENWSDSLEFIFRSPYFVISHINVIL